KAGAVAGGVVLVSERPARCGGAGLASRGVVGVVDVMAAVGITGGGTVRQQVIGVAGVKGGVLVIAVDKPVQVVIHECQVLAVALGEGEDVAVGVIAELFLVGGVGAAGIGGVGVLGGGEAVMAVVKIAGEIAFGIGEGGGLAVGGVGVGGSGLLQGRADAAQGTLRFAIGEIH
ncbi:MAG: hypothetical protein ABL862_03475, partial [Candidatus Nitrotoga sp.]